MSSRPLVAVLASDHHLVADIHDTVAEAGAYAETVADAAEVRDALDRWPVLVLVDLAAPGWDVAVRWAKNQPHTRTIPIVAFGDNAELVAAQAECTARCDRIWERHRVSAELPDLLHNILHPATRWVEGWDAPPPPGLCRGAEQFNAGEFWECHETLEALWVAESRPIRVLYQGILQVGVAFHHLCCRNYAGAIKMLRRGLPRLHNLPETCHGVSVAALAAAARATHDLLVALGPDRIGELDLASLPRITITGCP